MKNLTTKHLTKIAILSTVAFILMFLDFSLAIFPPFYKLDFSEVAVLIGGFSMGPLAGVIIEAIKIVLITLLKGTTTAYVGEIANFLIGCAIIIPASTLYVRHKTKKNAVIGLVIGTITMAVIGTVMNYFVLLPAYSVFFHIEMDTIINMGAKVIPFIHNRLSFVLLATLPFNLIKGVIVSIFTLLIYKRISILLR